jgi:uncharacterized protein
MARPTALVTGASAGLGVLFAEALAKDGHDLILVARREDRIVALAERLAKEHGIAAHAIASDLTVTGAPEQLFAEISRLGLAVDTLINNAGFGLIGDFTGMDRARQAETIDLNCRALMELCHLALPGMIERKSGGILNVASTAAFQPGPWMAVYYATKAFVLSFSEALHEEVKSRGVRVAALCPGPTHTEFAGIAGVEDSFLFKRFGGGPEPVVADGLAALKANRAVKVSGAMNAVMAGSIRLTPRGLARRIAGSLQKRRSS